MPNACFFGIPVLDTSTATLAASTESGWWDLNPRPVAAATALSQVAELLSALASLIISFALCCFGASGKGFTLD